MTSDATPSGGTAAAFGFLYQYLRTASRLMDYLEAGRTSVVFISEDTVADQVDFSVRHEDGSLAETAQVKATMSHGASSRLSATEILRILGSLTEVAAERYVIYTNRGLSPSATRLSSILSSAPGKQEELSAELAKALHDSPQALRRLDELSAEQMMRLSLCTIQSDLEDGKDVAADLRDRIFAHRRAERLGIGEESSLILLRHVLCDIFERSALGTSNGLSVAEFGSLLGTPELELARAGGKYEWGRPLGALPPSPDLDRDDILGELTKRFHGLPTTRVPRTFVLTGLSGIGKSSAAAAYAHTYSALYDWVLWVDATQQETIRSVISLAVEANQADNLDPVKMSDRDLQARFVQTIGESVGTWLIVFDNAASAHTVRDWIPSVGHVDVIGTSIDPTSWSQWQHLDIKRLSTNQSRKLFSMRLWRDFPDLEPNDLDEIIKVLGGWPLAIELACSFLRSTGRSLRDVTTDYLGRLRQKMVVDSRWTPPSYRTHPTLSAAVLVALDYIDRSGDSDFPLAPRTLLETLAYVGSQDAPLFLATPAACLVVSSELNDASWVTAAEEAENTSTILAIDEAIAVLVSTSLIRRHQNLKFDAVTSNDIILEIVRGQLTNSVAKRIVSSLQVCGCLLIESLLNGEDYFNMRVLVAPISEILAHATALQVVSPESIVMMGNLGNCFKLLHDFQSARNAFERELKYLNEMGDSGPVLVAMAESAIVDCIYESTSSLSELLRHAHGAVDAYEVSVSAYRDAITDPTAFAASIENLKMTLSSPSLRESDPAIISLLERLTRAHAVLGLGENEAIEAFGQIEAAIALGDGKAAIRIIHDSLAHGTFPRSLRLQLGCMLIEAYALVDVRAAVAQIPRALGDLTSAGLSPRIAIGYILNAWVGLLMNEVKSPKAPASLDFLTAVYNHFDMDCIIDNVDRYRYNLCFGGTLVLHGEVRLARAYLEEATSSRGPVSLRFKSDQNLVELNRVFEVILSIREANGGSLLLFALGSGELSHGPTGYPTSIALMIRQDKFEELLQWQERDRLTGIRATWVDTEVGLALSLTPSASGWPKAVGCLIAVNHETRIERLQVAMSESPVVKVVLTSPRNGRTLQFAAQPPTM